MYTDIFDLFPLATVIENKVFSVHGGLSPNVDTIDDIRKLDRKQEVPRDGSMSDIIWSDPCPGRGPRPPGSWAAWGRISTQNASAAPRRWILIMIKKMNKFWGSS